MKVRVTPITANALDRTLYARRGFTLMALLLILTAVALFSAVVLAHLSASRSESRDAKRIADIEDIERALGSFFEAYGGYPAELSSATLVQTGFLIEIPIPPPGTRNQTYLYVPLNPGCTSYHLAAELEDISHPSLQSDVDAPASEARGTNCPSVNGSPQEGSRNDFSGTDPLFDVKP